ILCLFLVLAFVYQGRLDAKAKVGEGAADFALTTLAGEEVRLADFRGRPVVLNFWTTWCTECRAEVRDLEAIHQAYGERVVVLGVNMREPAGVVAPFLARYGATYTVALDRDKRVAGSYRITGVPETWIIGADGVALRHF